jgi:hypothetical protein
MQRLPRKKIEQYRKQGQEVACCMSSRGWQNTQEVLIVSTGVDAKTHVVAFITGNYQFFTAATSESL